MLKKWLILFVLFLPVVNASIAGTSSGISIDIETNCSDGTCAGDEDCSNCKADCGCLSGYECISGQCKKKSSGGSSSGSSYTPPIIEENNTENITYIPPSEEINITENVSEESPSENISEEININEPEEPIQDKPIEKWVLAGLSIFAVIIYIYKITIPMMENWIEEKHPKKDLIKAGLYHNGRPLLQNFKEMKQKIKIAKGELKESLKEYKKN